jgi:hypothetical protein
MYIDGTNVLCFQGFEVRIYTNACSASICKQSTDAQHVNNLRTLLAHHRTMKIGSIAHSSGIHTDVCMYVCIYIYIHAYIHTYIHTYICCE